MRNWQQNTFLVVMTMVKIKGQEYARAVVETRGLEKKMLPRDTLEALLDAKESQEVTRILKGKGYPGIPKEGIHRGNFDRVLRRAMEVFAEEIDQICPQQDFLDLIYFEHDIYNMKALLMSKDHQIGFEGDMMKIPASRVAHYEALASGEVTPSQNYYDQLFIEAQELYQRKGAKKLQEMLDKAYFQHLLQVAEDAGVTLFKDYAKAKVDFYNLCMVLRLERMGARLALSDVDATIIGLLERLLVPGGTIPLESLKEMWGKGINERILFVDGTVYRKYLVEGIYGYSFNKDLAPLEKKMDDYLTHLVKEKQYVALGPEALLGYLHGRTIEILNIRLILASVLLGVPRHIVKERLRESYV